jgi:hypothetical protein
MSLDKLGEKAQEIEKEDDLTTQQKWVNVRQQAIQFLREKKERWQRLQDERQIRLTEVVIYFIFVVLVTVVALTSRNTEVHPPPPPSPQPLIFAFNRTHFGFPLAFAATCRTPNSRPTTYPTWRSRSPASSPPHTCPCKPRALPPPLPLIFVACTCKA